MYLAARRAVAAAYFRNGSPEAVQTAMKWDPGNPEYYDALANLMHVYANRGNSDEIVQLYEEATRLSPDDAQFWADLGAGYDWGGRSNDALEAFQHALRLFPNSPEISWRLANFYVRTGRIPEALHALRMVLQEDGAAGRRAFTLATNATGDRKALLEMLPPQAPILFGYLNFEIERGDMSGAVEVWVRLLQLNLPFDLRQAFPYFDALVQHRDLGQLSETWSALAQRFPSQIQRPVPESNLVTNGSFESDILNGGFDWRVVPTEAAVVSVDSSGPSDGARALRITFDGSRNVDYGNVYQYVPVQANASYRFSARIRAQGITTDSGPRLQVCDAYDPRKIFASTENLVGTSGWAQQQAEFTTPPDTHLLLIRIVRPVSNKFDNQIAGTVWIDDVRLSSE